MIHWIIQQNWNRSFLFTLVTIQGKLVDIRAYVPLFYTNARVFGTHMAALLINVLFRENYCLCESFLQMRGQRIHYIVLYAYIRSHGRNALLYYTIFWIYVRFV